MAAILLTKEDKSLNEEAIEILKKQCDKGHSRSMSNLAICYMNGINCKKDHLMARQLFEEAAELKEPDSFFYLGYIDYQNNDF